ncbi:hypothetical protein GCM10027596_17050 [Nocardioides korecus]
MADGPDHLVGSVRASCAAPGAGPGGPSRLGVVGAVVLLVGLVAVLSARPALVRLGPRLWWWSLLTSGAALAAVVAFLV